MKIIKVGNGFVQGRIKTILGKEIVEFLAIPYCIPPINELRFRKAQTPIFFDGIINKSEFKTCPPQLPFKIFEDDNIDEQLWIPKEEQSDDCLYLNIWCPLSILERNENYSVFVWIYGGGFVSGSSSLPIYNGSIMAIQENIIVVSFNYRVGMLGFLCLDDEISGNQGIWDQVIALKWIYDNITFFRGDKNNITLGGNSAGGCSVTLHLIIEESWSYFNKIIAQSGVCLSDWALLPKEELINRSEKIVNHLLKKFNMSLRWHKDMGNENKNIILNILNQMDFKEFLVDSYLCQGLANFAWTPCVDGVLIKDSPETMFKSKKFKMCPTIFLNVENESTFFILYQFPDIIVREDNIVDSKYFEECLKYYPFYPYKCSLSVKDKIIKEYNIDESKISIQDLEKVLSDRHFVSDSIRLANYICEHQEQVYYLWFRTSSMNTEWPRWVGVMHGDEIYHLFGYNLIENEKIIDKSCIQYMYNIGYFMKNGSLPDGLPLYSTKNSNFILIENDKWEPSRFTEGQIEKFSFWDKLRKSS